VGATELPRKPNSEREAAPLEALDDALTAELFPTALVSGAA